MAINVGSKYYRNTKDGRTVLRVLSHDKDIKTTQCLNLEFGESETVMDKTLNDQFIELIPEMLLDIMIVEMEDGTKDVYGWVYRFDYIFNGLIKPIVMLRANVYSYFKNLSAKGNDIWVGECINDVDNPNQGSLMDLAEFTKVIESRHLSMYLTDNVSDLIQCVDVAFKAKVDEVLNEMSDRFTESPNIKGYARTLEELMTINDFIGETRAAFNIHKVDWKVILDEDSYDINGDIVLNGKQKQALEDILRQTIDDIRIVPYDKDVDVSKIVRFSHIMVSDATNQIYLIAYRKISDYPPDNDITRGMGLLK